MQDIKTALAFLTIFRPRLDPIPDMKQVGESAWAFPLIGAGIGLVLVLGKALLGLVFPPIITALGVLTLWLIVTGGLHVDGWCDCWDALAAPVTPERRREILKDSRLGTFGAIALTLLLGFKAAALVVATPLYLPLLAAPIIGRGIMVITAKDASYGDEGMGSGFVAGVSSKAIRVALAAILIFGVLCGFRGFIAVILALAAASWFKVFAQRRLGMVNGDVLGAVCELAEVVFIVFAVGR